MNPKKTDNFGILIDNFDNKDLDVTLITSKPMSKNMREKLKEKSQKELGVEIGSRNIVDRRQLQEDNLPI